MSGVSLSAEGYVVDAQLLAHAFGVSLEAVRAEMRDGMITSRCETGVGTDEGRSRMTFYRGDRAFRIVVSTDGTVLSRSTFPVVPSRANSELC